MKCLLGLPRHRWCCPSSLLGPPEPVCTHTSTGLSKSVDPRLMQQFPANLTINLPGMPKVQRVNTPSSCTTWHTSFAGGQSEISRWSFFVFPCSWEICSPGVAVSTHIVSLHLMTFQRRLRNYLPFDPQHTTDGANCPNARMSVVTNSMMTHLLS